MRKFQRLKEELKNSVELEIFPEQKKEIIGFIRIIFKKDIADEDFKKILKIQQLLEESKKDD